MPTEPPSLPPETSPAHRSRGVRAFLRRLRRAADAAPSPAAVPGAAAASVDLVDQAQAFQTLRVADVMTPRADVVAVEISSSFDELSRQFAETEHSRLPIYRETLDDPVGVAHIKDVFKLLAGANPPQPGDRILHRLRREVLYVPASMRAADLLLRMQASRVHMALVIDEFGGTDGLVTLEDLIEAVVGDIDDEHDEAALAQIVVRPGGLYEADARAPLDELEAALGESLALADFEEEIETVAGLVVALAGRVPRRGEVISHPAGLDFEVVDADPRRIKQVRVRRLEPAEPSETAPAQASAQA